MDPPTSAPTTPTMDPPADLLKMFIQVAISRILPSEPEKRAQAILKTYVRNVETPEPDQRWERLVKNEDRLQEYMSDGGEVLVDKLLECQNNGDYSYLQTLTKDPPPEKQEKDSAEIEGYVREAFKGQYIGDLSFIKRQIRLLLKLNDVYSKSFAIIQSSGTGKSRLIQELATEWLTFPLCLRTPDLANSFSWPPYDKLIYDHFNGRSNGHQDKKIVALCFLKGLFDNAVEQLGKTPLSWSKKFSPDNRPVSFYKMVLKTAKEAEAAAGGNPRKIGVKELREELRKSIDASLKKLRKSVDPAFSGIDVPVIVCFDEAQGLGDYLASFTSAFRDLKRTGVVGIYLSTNSSMRPPAPTNKLISSERITFDSRLGRTFTELPLDVFAHETFEGPIEALTLDKIRSIRAAASLGRPMWTAHLKAKYPASKLLRLAMNKLAGTRQIVDISHEGKLAVLACRLLIQCRPVSRAPAEDLVASHLATAYFSTPERSELVVGYPPEPLVSAAAFKIMHDSEFRKWPSPLAPSSAATSSDPDVKMLDVSTEEDTEDLPITSSAGDAVWVGWLRMWLRQDLISRGDRGELASRVILTLARDQAYIEDNGPFVDWEDEIGKGKVLPGHSPVKLTTFLKKLVGEAAWDKLRRAGPVNLSKEKKSLEEYFAKSVIDFSCFTATDDKSIFTHDGMVSALLQGAGVVCEPNQPTYDHVIPFLIDKDKGFVKDNIGIIGEQAKNRAALSDPIIDPWHEDVLGESHPVPVITIVSRHGHRVLAVSRFSPARPSTGNNVASPPPHYHLLVGVTPLISTDAQLDILQTGTLLERYRHSVEATLNGGAKDFATEGVKIMREKRIYGVSADNDSNHFKRGLKRKLTSIS